MIPTSLILLMAAIPPVHQALIGNANWSDTVAPVGGFIIVTLSYFITYKILNNIDKNNQWYLKTKSF